MGLRQSQFMGNIGIVSCWQRMNRVKRRKEEVEATPREDCLSEIVVLSRMVIPHRSESVWLDNSGETTNHRSDLLAPATFSTASDIPLSPLSLALPLHHFFFPPSSSHAGYLKYRVSIMSKLSKINHAAGIFADMSVDGPPIGTLVAIIDRAKNLPNRKTMGKQNPYCAARLGKEAKKTPTDLRGGQTPRW